MRIADLLRRLPPGFAPRMAAAAFAFLFWRLAGMPMPGTLGRLLPLAWVLSALIGATPAGRFETASLTAFATAGLLWPMSPLLAPAAGVALAAGAIPSMLGRAARGAAGAAAALLPVVPLIMATVPFTGDEPFNAALARSLLLDGDMDISDDLPQVAPESWVTPELGSPRPGITHHQPLFALFLVPGLLLGVPGYRLLPLLFACGAAAATARLLSRSGRDTGPAGWAILFLPGLGCAGLAYPDWAAALLTVAGAASLEGRQPVRTCILAALALAVLKIRFAPAGLGLVAAAISSRGRRSLVRAALLTVALGILALAVDRLLPGGGFFWARYGNVEFLRTLVHGTAARAGDILLMPAWMLLDQEAGLLWRAPWLVAAVAGLPALARERGPSRALLLSGILYAVGIAVWTPMDWHSMPTPTGRLLIPLLPLAAVSASRAGMPRPLLAVSAVMAATSLALPMSRFNHLDGRDALLDMFSSCLPHDAALWLPSMARPDLLVLAAWAGLSAALIMLLSRRTALPGALLLAAAAAVLAARAVSLDGVYEAEDLGPERRIGCSLYPELPDPNLRLDWRRSPERLLMLSDPWDAVILTSPGGGVVEVSARLSAMSAGAPALLRMEYGGEAREFAVESRVLPVPDWIGDVRGGRESPRRVDPGVLSDTLVTAVFEGARPGPLVIRRGGDSGVLFLDRIEVSSWERR